jgi:hypothetical protein
MGKDQAKENKGSKGSYAMQGKTGARELKAAS